MKLIKKTLYKLNGLHYGQEYLCLAKEYFESPLHVYLVDNKQIIKDITNDHLFTGYSPLIFTFCSYTEWPVDMDIIFSHRHLQSNDLFTKKDAVASLSLKLIHKQTAGDTAILYYEGVKGAHHFLSSFHQYIIGLNNRLYNKKPGNVFLHGNLYKQVQIAYALPRIISLITVSDGDAFNLFPTDLHGPVNEQYYVCSLRHEGKACRQVESAGRIVISQVEHTAYKTVYSLGKNHMQDLKSRDNFPFGPSFSRLFQLPLPQPALYYRELELVDSFIHGIHKLLLFKVLSQQVLSNEPHTLAHIHNVYASWRHNKGLSGNYLLR